MSDCEETDFFWESWILPGKKKRKKDSKKDKKCLKRKNSITVKTDESIKKKKKKSKFKEAMEGRKEKKKEKRKNKNILALELDITAQAKLPVKPKTLNPHSNDKLKPDHLTQDSKKKTKRKKKVAFDLSPGDIRIKRPKFVSLSQQSPKESVLLENGAVRDRESCSQVVVTGHSQGQMQDNNSQGTNDDINSQDLFITQKTFTAPPSEPSSSEASDKAVAPTPQMFTRRDKLQALVVQRREGSCKRPQDPHLHQHHGKSNKHVQKPKTVQVPFTEEEEVEKEEEEAHQNPKKGKLLFQTQIELNTKLTEEKKVSCPVHVKPRVMKPYLDEPIVVNSSLDVAKSKKRSCTSSQQSPSCLQHTDEPSVLPPASMASTSTQTENFFTTALSSYLSFCQKSRVTAHFEDLKPLDLSLTQRARKDLGTWKGENHKEPSLHASCSSHVKDVGAKKEPSGRHPRFRSTQGKGETTPSPQSESEPKSADTTTSSEDNEPLCRTGKLDLAQVRAVQMRLNESFFFKPKGEGQSPRPESPLMKLAQGREVKSRKGH